MADRPEIEWEWCQRVIDHPEEAVEQPNGCWRMWGYILEAEKSLRVITLGDRETVDNAFLDRTYTRRKRP
jgi:hypothetical protein